MFYLWPLGSLVAFFAPLVSPLPLPLPSITLTLFRSNSNSPSQTHILPRTSSSVSTIFVEHQTNNNTNPTNSLVLRASIAGAAGVVGLLSFLLGGWLLWRRRRRNALRAGVATPLRVENKNTNTILTRRELKRANKKSEGEAGEGGEEEGKDLGYSIFEVPRVEPYVYTAPSQPATSSSPPHPTIFEEPESIQEVDAADAPVYWNRNEGLAISDLERTVEKGQPTMMGPPQILGSSDASTSLPRIKQ